MLFDCCTYRIPTRLACHSFSWLRILSPLSLHCESAAWMANPTIQVRVARQFNFMVPFLFTAAAACIVANLPSVISHREKVKWHFFTPSSSNVFFKLEYFLAQWWLNSKFGNWLGDSFIKQQLAISAKASLYNHLRLRSSTDLRWMRCPRVDQIFDTTKIS